MKLGVIALSLVVTSTAFAQARMPRRSAPSTSSRPVETVTGKLPSTARGVNAAVRNATVGALPVNGVGMANGEVSNTGENVNSGGSKIVVGSASSQYSEGANTAQELELTEAEKARLATNLTREEAMQEVYQGQEMLLDAVNVQDSVTEAKLVEFIGNDVNQFTEISAVKGVSEALISGAQQTAIKVSAGESVNVARGLGLGLGAKCEAAKGACENAPIQCL